MKLEAKKLSIWVIILLIIGVAAFFAIQYQNKSVVIRNFDDCVRAGKLVVDSVPRRCEISKDQFIVDVTELTSGNTGMSGQCKSYTFDAYPVEISRNLAKSVDYSSRTEAERNKTIIDEAFKKGPNFSGHYVIASWGCGTACQESAIINASDGKILVFGIISEYGVQTRVNSKLLVINPKENLPDNLTEEEQKTLVTNFYTLDNNALVLLCRENTWINNK